MSEYRVQKGNQTFYIKPEMLEYYADNGYEIFKVTEQKVRNVDREINESSQDSQQSTTIPEEVK